MKVTHKTYVEKQKIIRRQFKPSKKKENPNSEESDRIAENRGKENGGPSFFGSPSILR